MPVVRLDMPGHLLEMAFDAPVAKVFLAKYREAAPYPIKDPRLIEAMGMSHPVATQISGGELDQTDDLLGGPKTVAKGGR